MNKTISKVQGTYTLYKPNIVRNLKYLEGAFKEEISQNSGYPLKRMIVRLSNTQLHVGI